MQKSSLEQRDAEKNAGVHHMLLVQYLFTIIRAHTYTCTFIFIKTFLKYFNLTLTIPTNPDPHPHLGLTFKPSFNL